jgi:phosphopantetheine--protein transferase-like protein
MDGDFRIEQAASYLSRLTGQSVTPHAPLALRSVHRAAFAAWARQAQIALREELIGSIGSYSLRDLMAEDEAMAAPAGLAEVLPPAGAAAMFSGVGIDIEAVAALPEADDYREHPFYQAHFAPSEIGYAIRQPDMRATLCGIWAAKEALLKAGIIAMPARGLSEVEILRDAQGRPGFAGCHISISHTRDTAVAVCLPARPSPEAAPPAPAAPMQFTPADDAAKTGRPWGRFKRLGFAAGALVMLGAILIILKSHGGG